MVDIAMHIMDIAQNSIRAGATCIEISIQEETNEYTLQLRVKDNGIGMSKASLDKVIDPFYTTRTTRRIGLGVPLLKMTCEQAGGYFNIKSGDKAGTIVNAVYKTDHPDCLPLGDIAGYIVLLLIANPEIRFIYRYKINDNEFCIDTDELRSLGIDLQDAQMKEYIKEYLNECLKEIQEKADIKMRSSESN